MELHVCITIDDDAVNKIANVITETVKKVEQIQRSGGARQPAIETQPDTQQGPPTGIVPGAVPTTPYSAQIAQATQQPVRVMTGQPVSMPQTSQRQTTAQAPLNNPSTMPVQQSAVPTAARAYTLEELAGAAMLLMDRGMQVQLQDLLAGYGVESLPALPPEQYGSFATALRGMGAQI